MYGGNVVRWVILIFSNYVFAIRFVHLPEKIRGILSVPSFGSVCSQVQERWCISRDAVSPIHWSLLVCRQLWHRTARNANQRKT